MIKNLKKNKKGFTLIEIIVVLVIMGILLAIAVPSVLGYVSKANDQKYIALARNGYVGAQGIIARENATQPATRTPITGANLNTEIKEAGAITSASCKLKVSKEGTQSIYKISSCDITIKDQPGRKIVFNADSSTSEIEEGAAVDGAATDYPTVK